MDDMYDEGDYLGNGDMDVAALQSVFEQLRADGYSDADVQDMLQQYMQTDEGSIGGLQLEERQALGVVWENCVYPSLSQAAWMLWVQVMLCLAAKLVGIVLKDDSDLRWLMHMIYASFGVLALYLFVGHSCFHILFLTCVTYGALVVARRTVARAGVLVTLTVLIHILSCELWFEAAEWHRIRGSQMVLAMKAISVAVNLDSGALQTLPSLPAYLGYALHPGTVVLGPWIPYAQYEKHDTTVGSFSLRWVLRILKSGVLALCCVVTSNCLSSWLLLSSYGRWVVAYRDAQSFRLSHYFVSFMSEANLLTSGLAAADDDDGSSGEGSVSRPLKVELPRSLVMVVTSWNIPMHNWIRTYVFKEVRPLGNFVAILLTYAASALLHGLNFQLAAVLFSLGFYSYVEYMLRRRLAEMFSACILAKPCKEECDHKYKWSNWGVLVTNGCLGLVTVFHLAYLGLMFDSSATAEEGYSMNHTISKWRDLSFASHWLALGTFVFYKLL